MTVIPEHNKLVLFDGVCNLCNPSIQYIIKHDKKNMFLFAPLQSELANQIIKSENLDVHKTDSILLYEPKNGVSIKSTAALKIAKSLGFPVNLSLVFFIVPPFIRNLGYDYIAKNRYKWYGKRESCMIPSPDLEAKFLK